MAADYDLVILNGRVMDPETMLDAVLNVGVKDGKIAAITKEKTTGKETLNAKGLVVAPGLIDTHFHSLDGLSMKMAARDGVTTGMDLEIGAINVDEWYAAKKDQWPLNYGTTISQEGEGCACWCMIPRPRSRGRRMRPRSSAVSRRWLPLRSVYETRGSPQ